MLEKDKLRKADIFSGAVICLFGLWVVSRALQMPMKDSWGGVQNVWYVSPALFPLIVGGMISILGILLIRTAFKSVGREALLQSLHWLASAQLLRFLKKPAEIRFYAMAVLFFSFVFLNLPRTDFLLSSVLFLAVFISMFHFDDDRLLLALFGFYLAGTAFFLLYFVLGLPGLLASAVAYPSDWLIVAFIASYQAYAWRRVRRDPALRRKYRHSLILAVVPPFVICPIFKYFLLVPMPTEGLVTAAMDAIWYWDF